MSTRLIENILEMEELETFTREVWIIPAWPPHLREIALSLKPGSVIMFPRACGRSTVTRFVQTLIKYGDPEGHR